MKALIKFRDGHGRPRQVTASTENGDPNEAIRKAVSMSRIMKSEFVKTVRIGSREYQWHDKAEKAFPAKLF